MCHLQDSRSYLIVTVPTFYTKIRKNGTNKFDGMMGGFFPLKVGENDKCGIDRESRTSSDVVRD